MVAIGSGTALLAFDGSRIDGGFYTSVTDLARDIPSVLRPAVDAWSTVGLVLYALLMVAAWWRARRGSDGSMARVLMSPVATVVAALLVLVVKSQVQELRPCISMAHAFVLETCPARSDYAFPSNHTAMAFAAALTLWFADRRIGAIGLIVGVVLGVQRVIVGAHYPHDVLAGLVLGVVVAMVAVWLADRFRGVVGMARNGALRPLLAAPGAAGSPGPRHAGGPGVAPGGNGDR